MKVAVILLAVVAYVSSLPVGEEKKAVPRTYFPEEENPLRQRYLVLRDDNGHYHIEDLWRDPGEVRNTINDVTFFLYTVNNPNDPDVIPAGSFHLVASSRFSPARQNLFISHGWNNNFESQVNQVIRQAVLSRFDVNVFVIDWSGPANQFYTTAMAAVPAMGGFVGGFINNLMSTFGLSPLNFNLAGHSLGAHLVGVAGSQVNGLVNSIVGLDPAGPLFTIGNIANRIDPTDGDHVQIIHTNSGFLGFGSSIGDADYYPNGGSSQPGCGIDLIGTCAHSRAFLFFAESISSSGFGARSCATHQQYTAGLCNDNHRALMGEFHVDKSAFGDYHLITNSASPFARG